MLYETLSPLAANDIDYPINYVTVIQTKQLERNSKMIENR